MEKKIMLLLLISLLIGGVFGFSIGVNSGVNWCVDRGLKFLKLNNVTLDIDTDFLKAGINMYKDRVTKLVERKI